MHLHLTLLRLFLLRTYTDVPDSGETLLLSMHFGHDPPPLFWAVVSPSTDAPVLLIWLLQTLLLNLFCCPAAVAVAVFFIFFRRFLFQAGKSSSNLMVAVCIFL